MPGPLNILLVTTDQQRGDCLGVAKSVHPVLTPHLDQIAAEGVRFERAYTDCPMCIPARTTIMTGTCAYHHGQTNMSTVRPFPEEDRRTLPGRLAQAGYQTHAAGKMHFSPPRARHGFERMRLLPEDYVNWLETTEFAGMYRGHGLGGNEVYPGFAPTPVLYTHNHWIVDESIDFLRQRDPQCPFFMWTSFEAPHSPFDPPESFVRLYDGIDIPETTTADWAQDPYVPRWVKRTRILRKFDQLSSDVIRTARKHYYAQITHIDYELGRLFGELQSQGLYNDTLILFTSDHGDMLGDFGLFAKSCFYEASSKVPFILRLPKNFETHYSRGQVVSGPIQLADIFPTLLDAAGIWSKQEGDERDGVSLLEADNDVLSKRWIFGYVDEMDGFYMATNGDWKYVYYVNGGTEQLFNLAQDPEERFNVAENEPEQLVMCRQELKNGIPAIGDDHSESGLVQTDSPLPSDQDLRAANPFAWRGPIRYGRGY